MNWLNAAKSGINAPKQTAKEQENNLKSNRVPSYENPYKNPYINPYINGCEYHGSKDLPCWDCVIDDHDYDCRDNDLDEIC
jgi:hypothetical protein